MKPSRNEPRMICKNPAKTTAHKKSSKEPNEWMAVATMAVSPAAGPDTPSAEPEIAPTTIPPTIPAIKPENKGASDAKAIPKHSGTATRKTTSPEGTSYFQFLKKEFIKNGLKL